MDVGLSSSVIFKEMYVTNNSYYFLRLFFLFSKLNQTTCLVGVRLLFCDLLFGLKLGFGLTVQCGPPI